MDTRHKSFKSEICLSKLVKTGSNESPKKPYSPNLFKEEKIKNLKISDSEDDDFEVFEIQDDRFKLSSNEFVKG